MGRCTVGSEPLGLGRHDLPVRAVVVLQEGWVAGGGCAERELVWDATTQTEIAQLGRSGTALAAGSPGRSESSLVVALRRVREAATAVDEAGKRAS